MDAQQYSPEENEPRGEKFHVLNESRSLIAAFLLPKFIELYPEERAEWRAEQAFIQAHALLGVRRRWRDAELRRRKGCPQ